MEVTEIVKEIPLETWIEIKSILIEGVAAIILVIISTGVLAIKYGVKKIIQDNDLHTREIINEVYNNFSVLCGDEQRIEREVSTTHKCVDETKKMILELGALMSGEFEKTNQLVQKCCDDRKNKDALDSENAKSKVNN